MERSRALRRSCSRHRLERGYFYRTVAGFAALVEKDWCAFGYQFSKRRDAATDDHSPIFLQWLDCVWQALRQTRHASSSTKCSCWQ